MNTSRQPRRGAAALYRPVASGWQKWLRKDGGTWEMAAEGMELADLKPSAGALIAVPVRRAFSLALWAPAADPQIFGDLVYTQLELRGLGARTRSTAAFTWEEIATEGDEALLHAVVLPSHLAPRYWHGEVTNYAVSPSCLPLQPDAVTLWREEGVWVAAVTRGGKLLHFQPLTEKEPDGQMALEIWLMLAPLEAGRMLGGAVSAVLLYEVRNRPICNRGACRAEFPSRPASSCTGPAAAGTGLRSCAGAGGPRGEGGGRAASTVRACGGRGLFRHRARPCSQHHAPLLARPQPAAGDRP